MRVQSRQDSRVAKVGIFKFDRTELETYRHHLNESISTEHETRCQCLSLLHLLLLGSIEETLVTTHVSYIGREDKGRREDKGGRGE